MSAWRSSAPRTRPSRCRPGPGAIDELMASGALSDALGGPPHDDIQAELDRMGAGHGVDAELARMKAELRGRRARPRQIAGSAARLTRLPGQRSRPASQRSSRVRGGPMIIRIMGEGQLRLRRGGRRGAQHARRRPGGGGRAAGRGRLRRRAARAAREGQVARRGLAGRRDRAVGPDPAARGRDDGGGARSARRRRADPWLNCVRLGLSTS